MTDLSAKWSLVGYAGDSPTEDGWEASDELPTLEWFETKAEADAALVGVKCVTINFISDFYSFHVVAPGDAVPTFGQQVKAWGGPEDWPEVSE